MFTVEEKLPDFWKSAKETALALQNNKFSGWQPLLQKISPLLEEDFIAKMEAVIPGWQEIASIHDGQTAKHTLFVLALCLNLPEYTSTDKQTRWEIEWAAVLHDLDKKIARSDTAHPFRSAAVVAPIMPSLGFEVAPEATQADIPEWSALVMSALRPDGERMLHDHTKLKEIIAGIHYCWGKDTPASRVLKAILLHQSLPTLNDWPNAVLLTDDELAFALTVDDMKVLGPLMVADSDSWNIFDPPRNDYLFELRANNAETIQRIKNASE